MKLVPEKKLVPVSETRSGEPINPEKIFAPKFRKHWTKFSSPNT
jgi:hypothetical protein